MSLSIEHEDLVELFRARPALAVELLWVLGQELPELARSTAR